MAKRNLLGLVLSFEERKRLADYFVVLITVHKQVKVHEKKSKKAKKAKCKLTDIGPRIRGPILSFVEGPSFFCTTKMTFVLQYHIFLCDVQ